MKRQIAELNEDKNLIMEDKGCVTSIPKISNGILRTKADHRPAHYLFKIQSYSSLTSSKVEKYESGEFEAGGYKWMLVFYPRKDNNDDCIPLFLAIAETEKLPAGWEVHVHFRFFVKDQIRDRYLIIQDVKEVVRRFYPTSTEWGIELLPMDTFKDIANGYLVDDSCVFGAEVFVVQCTGKCECLATVKDPVYGIYTWKINNFSQMNKHFYESESFTVVGSKWNLRVYPNRESSAKNKWLSVYLQFNIVERLPSIKKCYAEYTLRVKNQIHASLTIDKSGEKWFRDRSNCWGYHEFVSLKDLNNASKGIILNDTVIVECQINKISIIVCF